MGDLNCEVSMLGCFVHCSHELNMSVRQSGFTVYRRYKPEKKDKNMLKVEWNSLAAN